MGSRRDPQWGGTGVGPRAVRAGSRVQPSAKGPKSSSALRDATGIPLVLNTSFNENELVVNTPAQALDCFLRTKMDLLVMGDVMIRRE
ncbi:MAG TPA: carbamoyltransferase C-terminal domain-containing protein [Thermoanaerobaculia bacterium]|nr:carbamoyltransferase C-terminal domain-containing protein [Thermoanaerobaculia bacterium]